MPSMNKRELIKLLPALGAAAFAPAWAQNAYPSRPVRVIVGFSAGGGVDLVARPLAQRLASLLKQSVVVENKAGANGNLAASYVQTVAPDGYTLLHISSSMATVNPFLYKSGAPDILGSFTPIAGITDTPQAVIVPVSLGVRTVKDLVTLARDPKRGLNFASGGIGGLAHLAFEKFKRDESLKMEHVPYKGTGPALQDMVAGRVHLMIDNVAQVKPQLDAGQLRLLAIAGPRRLAAYPDVVTTAEAGYPGLLAMGWQALMAPAKTPEAAVEMLRVATKTALEEKEFVDAMLDRATILRWASAEDVRSRIRRESAIWSELIREVGITAE